MTQTQPYLTKLSQIVNENIEAIFKEFNLRPQKNSRCYVSKCPIHVGDNYGAFNYYHNESKYFSVASWKCWTHHCEDFFKKSPIGFVRGLLSSRINNWRGFGDDILSFPKTLEWIEKFFSINQNNIEAVKLQNNNNIPIFSIPEPKIHLTRQQVRDTFKRPPTYFISRGFSKDILNQYDVGSPIKPIPKYYFREFAPVYSLNGEYCIGGVARSVFEACPKCKGYHDHNFPCPNPEVLKFYCKWKNWLFDRGYSLYNFWNSHKHIRQSESILLVEGQGNIWKLQEAGISNSVSAYGTGLSWPQMHLLRNSGAKHLFIATDNDEPGKLAFNKIGRDLWQDFFIHKIHIPQEFNDIGEMKVEQIQEVILPQLKDK